MNQRTEDVPLFPGIWSWKLPTQQSGQGRRLGCPRRSWASRGFCPQSPSAPASSWHCWWSAGSWPPQGQDAPQPPQFPTSGPPNHCVRTNRKYLCNPHIINIVWSYKLLWKDRNIHHIFKEWFTIHCIYLGDSVKLTSVTLVETSGV